MTWMLFVGAVALALPWGAQHYLHRLPYAPECPRCRAVTGQPSEAGVADRFLSLLSATSLRICTRCGWAGRMRWKLAAERARGRRHS